MLTPKQKPLLVIVVIGFVMLLHIVSLSSGWKYTTDDSYITYRYSKNLAQGQGPVFNSGGDPVEGYTSPLWMLILSVTYHVSNNLELNSKLLGTGLNLATIVFLWKIIDSHFSPKSKLHFLFVIIVLLWVSLSSPFVISSVEGLETPLLSLFLIITLYLIISPIPNSTKAILLAFSQAGMYFSRPDALLLVACIALFWLSGWLPNSNRISYQRRKYIFLCYSLFSILLVSHLSWRYLYYGYFFPSTYYAKQGGTLLNFLSGTNRIVTFVQDTWISYLIILIPISFGARSLIIKNRNFFMLTSFLILTRLGFVIYSGGEIMGFHRFLVPIIPLFGILWMFTLLFLEEFSKKYFAAKNLDFQYASFIGIAVIILGSHSYQLFKDIRQVRNYRDFLSRNHEKVGYWLRDNVDDSLLVAAGDVGITFYIADKVDVLDLMGLNDYHIAQLPGTWIPRGKSPKSDIEYIFDQEPDMIILRGNPNTQPIDRFQIIEQDIIKSSYFWQTYSLIYNTDWLYIYSVPSP